LIPIFFSHSKTEKNSGQGEEKYRDRQRVKKDREIGGEGGREKER
jgi:hypothetical protein